MRIRFLPLIAVISALVSVAPARARSQTDTALKLTTSTPQAAAEFRAGMKDYENVSSDAAASHFQAAINADPNFGLARVMYAGISGTMSPAKREAELNRGVADAARGNTNELLLALAYREGYLGHVQASRVLARAAAQLMASDRLLAFGTANSAGPDSVLNATREFVSRNPDYAPAYNGLAYRLWAAGDRTGALAAAKRQVELNPTAPNPHDTYAEILQWNGNFPEATAHYKQATTLSPRFPEAYAGLAEVEALQGRYDQARAYLNQAIANAWTPQQKLGYMYQIAGTYALQGSSADALTKQLDAIAAEAKALQDAESEAIAYSMMATVQANAGNAAAAHKSLGMSKAVSSGVPWAARYFGVMSHAQLKHWAPANEELTALKAMQSTNPASRTYAAAAEGYLATQQGRPADALKILMAADTTNLLVMNRIAEAHAALGHAVEAAAWYNKINSNSALDLGDFTNVNSRRRARMASASVKR